jgi:hypothetical protein
MPACQDSDYSLCWHFTQGPIAAGIHTGTSKDAPGVEEVEGVRKHGIAH